ncbi:MAG: methylmalonyl-CoA carboxyltransferase, partial [Hyphomicrobiales bacterium]|nr:methylmalonyl-CoA carboxyltransferase [Hyphomicrobiales bacterium]
MDALIEKRDSALAGGGAQKIQKRRERGLMSARERLDALFSAGTFQEIGLHARHETHGFGMENKDLPGDGVVTGIGFADGRPVAAFSQDSTVAGGSLGRVHAVKICEVMDYAEKAGIPVVGFNDSGGARIQEGVESLSGYGQVFNRNVRLSGVVPQIAVIAGHCAGGAAYSPALMDFIIMTRTNAVMFICGPEVIRAVSGEETSLHEIGSAEMQASISGNVHFVAEDDAHAIAIARDLLSYLPSNNMVDPPHNLEDGLTIAPQQELDALVPESPKQPFDVKQVIETISDEHRFLEVQHDFAQNIVVGFGRIGGIVVGFVANQPAVKAGSLDIDASDKASRFIRICNTFNVPLVTLVDVPGFLP